MEKSIKVYVGLDGDNDSIAVAAADGGGGAARFVGQIGHDLAQLLRVLSRLGGKREIRVVYEAGPTG